MAVADTDLFVLYERLVDLDVDSRQSELRHLAARDAPLAERLGRMLSLETEAADLFDKALVRDDAGSELRPMTIGRYSLLTELGRGGSGQVFRARQAQPDRVVALKILRDALVSPTQKRRFLQEIELLGRLEHRGISAIYDAGLDELQAEGGQKLGERLWFTMELVEGQPITRFAEQHDLSIEDRVRLLIQIADAMEHAHQRGVLHRDLKPANVLAYEADTASAETGGSHAWGRVKVLDFGIGRLEGGQEIEQTELTVQGMRLGTLAYMSPEQLAGQNQAIDTRSDIWSLGVVAYELLAGRQPFPSTGLSLLEMERRVRETEAMPLHRARPGIDKDLETIVAKALGKEKARRYTSIGAMGEDLRRFLAKETIMARPATAWYQMRKFSSRHRGLVAGLGVALLLLIAGSIAVLLFALEANRERERTQLARRGMSQLNDLFQEELIEAANPVRAKGKDPTIRGLLQGLERRLEDRFREYPAVRAELLRTLGQTRSALGELAEAEKSLRAALTIQNETLGPAHIETLRTRAALGEVFSLLGKHDEALVFRRRSVVLARSSLPVGNKVRLGLLGDLGHQLSSKGDPQEAEKVLREVAHLRLRYLGPDDEDTLVAQHNLAAHLSDRGRFEEARKIEMDVHAKARRILGIDHRMTQSSLNNLALDTYRCGLYEEALPLATENLERKRKIYGDLHHLTFIALNNQALILSALGRVEESWRIFDQALPKVLDKLGPESPVAILFFNNLAEECLSLDKVEEAHELMKKAIANATKVFGARHWRQGVHHLRLGEVYRKLGRQQEAYDEKVLAFGILLESLGPDNARTAKALAQCKELAQGLGEPERAAVLEKRLEAARAAAGAGSPKATAPSPDVDANKAGPGSTGQKQDQR